MENAPCFSLQYWASRTARISQWKWYTGFHTINSVFSDKIPESRKKSATYILSLTRCERGRLAHVTLGLLSVDLNVDGPTFILWNKHIFYKSLHAAMPQTLEVNVIVRVCVYSLFEERFLYSLFQTVNSEKSLATWRRLVCSIKYKVFWSRFYVEKYFNCDIGSLWFCRNMSDCVCICVYV